MNLVAETIDKKAQNPYNISIGYAINNHIERDD